jgi:hypothetical protein
MQTNAHTAFQIIAQDVEQDSIIRIYSMGLEWDI